MPHSESPTYGGQALIEGVMIRARDGVAMAVRRPDGTVVRHRQELPKFSQSRFRKYPFIRGILILLESVVVGTRALTYSTTVAYEEENSEPSNATVNKLILVVTYVVAIAIAIGLFLVLPVIATNWIGTTGVLGIVANLVEGVLRVVLLLAYIWGIGFMKDVRRMYGYHGAEHKVIAAAEAGVPMNPSQILEFAKEHPRCGTAFLITVGILGILLLSFTPREPLWILVGSRIVLIPLVMGIGYEIIRFASLHSSNPIARIFNAPNLLTQKITTKEPDEGMLEVAIEALEYAKEIDNQQ